MPRPRQNRTISTPPNIKGFNPLGYYSSTNKSIHLKIEEFETIRLLDYEGLNQEEAAKLLNVSRPTLTRIYESARKKVAKMLIEANQLLIEGGDFIFKENWYKCSKCGCNYNNPTGSEDLHCIICGEINNQLLL